MTVAYPGAPGAFSHEACLLFLPGEEAVSYGGFEEVLAAVTGGLADYGMLPVVNNAAGETGAGALIAKSAVRTVSEHPLKVRMHLLGLPGSKLDQIHTVVSHPVALRQCAATLAGLGLATEEASNTAIAAAALDSQDRAVLASEAAARIYGLEILKRDVHDRSDNVTRFAIVAREPQ